jgi:hypothetical protein
MLTTMLTKIASRDEVRALGWALARGSFLVSGEAVARCLFESQNLPTVGDGCRGCETMKIS